MKILRELLKEKNYKILLLLILSLTVSAACTSCNEFLPSAPESNEILNEPIDGLTPVQLSLHLKGDEEFGRIFGSEDGLGPIFVNNSCESCHIADGKGHPFIQLTRFGRMHQDGSFDPMIEFGGPQLQQRSITGYTPEEIPFESTGRSVFMPPAVTGLGLIASVQDNLILTMADPDDMNGDGISGRPNLISPPDYFMPVPGIHIENNGKYIGRFGRKAGAVSLGQQIAEAYINDIGITSEYKPDDLYNYRTGIGTGDAVPDPEISSTTVNNVEFYIRTLKPPPRRSAGNPQVLEGKKIFTQINCSGCHVPSLVTGTSDIEALNGKEFYPYTDLLLHDMGPELDDYYTEGIAETGEWRTTPLWGLGLGSNSQGRKSYFLHDGRAKSVDEAVKFHGGEAAESRDSYNNLSPDEKQLLLIFLESL